MFIVVVWYDGEEHILDSTYSRKVAIDSLLKEYKRIKYRYEERVDILKEDDIHQILKFRTWGNFRMKPAWYYFRWSY